MSVKKGKITLESKGAPKTRKRCPNGTRKNTKTGKCEPKKDKQN